MWLVETDRPIGIIAADAGFSNVTNFNRQFRAARHMSPREFRNYYIKHGSLPDPSGFELTKRSPSLESKKLASKKLASKRRRQTLALAGTFVN